MISMTSFTPPPMCDAERSTSVSRGGREPDLSGMDMSCESVRSPTCNTWGCRLAHVDMGLQAWLEVVVRGAWRGCVARSVVSAGVRLSGRPPPGTNGGCSLGIFSARSLATG